MFVMQKQLFRDSSQRLLGGVCAGLGHYLGVSRALIRIAFLISVFFFGISIPLYVISWALIPKARSVNERAKMKGEFQTSKTATKTNPSVNKNKIEKRLKFTWLSILINALSLVIGGFIILFTFGLVFGSPLFFELFWEIKINAINIYFNPVINLLDRAEGIAFRELVELLVALLPGIILVLKGSGFKEESFSNKLIGLWIFTLLISYFFL